MAENAKDREGTPPAPPPPPPSRPDETLIGLIEKGAKPPTERR
jgi:hypothetical protein